MKHYSWFKPYIDKKNYLTQFNDLLNKDSISMGIYTSKLENELKKLLNVKHVVMMNSGTNAIMAAAIALNKKKRLKILAPNLTWIATLNPSIILNHKIHLCDTLKFSEKIDFKKMNSLIEKIQPDLVYLVHLNGQPNYDKKFEQLRKKINFKVIEDAAQSFLVKYNNKYCGTRYEIGCFSLGVTKLFHSAYGGFCCTNSTKLYERLVAIRNNGVGLDKIKSDLQLSSFNGLNFKISDILSMIAINNLKKKSFIISKSKQIFSTYRDYLKNKNFRFLNIDIKDALPMYPQIIVKDRSHFINFFRQRISFHNGLRTVIEAYPKIQNKNLLKNSMYMSNHLVRLPSGPGYELKDIKNIIKILNQYEN